MNDELHWLGIAELSDAIARRHLSPVEIVDSLLERIAGLDDKLNVFVALDADGARKGALLAEQEISAGRRLGPLHGIPVAIKDVIDVGGLPTTCQSKILVGNVPPSDAASVSALRRAGAAILGKVATYEFALGGPSFDLPFPPARNPWHVEHSTGGSSSGSGVGVAAGLFPGALGTDTGGSVRNPASACGIVGLKPTYGRVSRAGVFPLAFSMDHVGPMARRVADIGIFLQAMEDKEQLSRVGRPRTDDRWAAGPGLNSSGLRGMRIGFVRHFHEQDMPADPEVTKALEAAARIFAEAGAELVTTTLPSLNEFSAVNRIILQAEAWAIHARWLRTRPQDYGKLTRQRMLAGAFLSAEDYVQAQQRRHRMIAAVEAAFQNVDLLLCASAMDPPCRIDDAEAVARTYPRQARTPFSVTGHPALAMMSGLSSERLPLSLQLVGRYWDEASVLLAAWIFERETALYKHRPPIG